MVYIIFIAFEKIGMKQKNILYNYKYWYTLSNLYKKSSILTFDKVSI